ncbi:MAG TPA: glycosyltransferase family 87 protein [Gaiellaceae bacterium]
MAAPRSRIDTQVRGVVELAVSTLPALIAPVVIVWYVAGAYPVKPYTMDGKYFPDGGFLFDLHILWKAGHDVVTGHSPYPFVYPAPAAILMAPFGALPWTVAVAAFSVVAIGAVVLALRVLGVRDWRCYGLALGWLPVASTTTLGALSTLLALGTALAWRYRDRRVVVALAVAAVVALKVFLWPLLLWLVATRRFRSAATSVVTGAALAVGCWAVIGFDGMLDYPRHLGDVASSQQGRSYSPFALMRALGLSNGLSRVGLLVLTVIALGLVFALARGRDGDRRAFVAAVGAALAVSPIVWLHYFALLYVVIALYRQRAHVAWFVPLAFWLTPHQDGAASAARILFAYAIAALAVGLATSPGLRSSRSTRAIPAPHSART